MYFYVLIPSVPCNSDHSPPSRPSFPLPQCRIAGQIFIFLADLSAFPDIQHFFLFFYVDMFPEDLIVYFINKKCFNTFFCPQNHISNKKKGKKKIKKATTAVVELPFFLHKEWRLHQTWQVQPLVAVLLAAPREHCWSAAACWVGSDSEQSCPEN